MIAPREKTQQQPNNNSNSNNSRENDDDDNNSNSNKQRERRRRRRQQQQQQQTKTTHPQARIRQYFYGDPHLKRHKFAPALVTVAFDDVAIVRIGDDRDDQASSAMTPLGQEHLMKLDPFRVRPVDPGDKASGLLHAVLAVTHAAEVADAADANVAGYLWVKSVDLKKRTLDVLQPNDVEFLKGQGKGKGAGGAKAVLVLGSFTFIDRL